MQERIIAVINEMSEVLNAAQLRMLQESLLRNVINNTCHRETTSNDEYVRLFLEAKRIEGCSTRTIAYYKATINHFITIVITPVRQVATEEIRTYLVNYQKRNDCSKVTVDNIRRNISSFFS